MKNLFLQTDPNLNQMLKESFGLFHLKRFGCYFISILNGVLSTSDYVFTEQDVYHKATRLLQKGYMDNDFYVRRPDKIVKIFCPDYDFGGKAKPQEINTKDACFAIEKWQWGNQTHFKLSHFCSLGGNSRTVTNGNLVGYRIFTRRNF